jgi:hypothetical protein
MASTLPLEHRGRPTYMVSSLMYNRLQIIPPRLGNGNRTNGNEVTPTAAGTNLCALPTLACG